MVGIVVGSSDGENDGVCDGSPVGTQDGRFDGALVLLTPSSYQQKHLYGAVGVAVLGVPVGVLEG
jgi:hypothetical protein